MKEEDLNNHIDLVILNNFASKIVYYNDTINALTISDRNDKSEILILGSEIGILKDFLNNI